MSKHIGIVGVSAEGTALCYRTICVEASNVLGSHHNPEVSIYQRNFRDILEAQKQEDWGTLTRFLVEGIKKVAALGAEFAIIPANSVHVVFDQVKAQSTIPLLSIIEVTVHECQVHGFQKVGILGVGLTMEKGLYRQALKVVGIESCLPSFEDQRLINDIIYNEIVPARVNDTTTARVLALIENLKHDGCDAVILGCTELPIVVNESNVPLPFIDTTRLLALRALEYSLE